MSTGLSEHRAFILLFETGRNGFGHKEYPYIAEDVMFKLVLA